MTTLLFISKAKIETVVTGNYTVERDFALFSPRRLNRIRISKDKAEIFGGQITHIAPGIEFSEYEAALLTPNSGVVDLRPIQRKNLHGEPKLKA